jgi:hypothetical protein
MNIGGFMERFITATNNGYLKSGPKCFTKGREYEVIRSVRKDANSDSITVIDDNGDQHILDTDERMFIETFNMPPQNFYFTFGAGQIPGLGYYTVIEAASAYAAREIMCRRTRKFCGQYDWKTFEHQLNSSHYSLTEIYWDEEYKGWSESPK